MALFDNIKSTICPEFSSTSKEAVTFQAKLFTEPGACKCLHSSKAIAFSYTFVATGFPVSNRFSMGDFSH
jgi:hypothetical protein